MLLGHKRIPLAKYYKILNIRKNNGLGLYANGITTLKIVIKTSNNYYEKHLKINSNDGTLSFTDYENVGNFVYTSDDNYLYLYFKPSYADRQIWIYSDSENIVAYFEIDNTEYELTDLNDYTSITDYVYISESSYLVQGITGSYKIKTIQDDIILFNMTITIADDLASGTKTLVQDLNLPQKTFVMLASTTDGVSFGVQYSNGKIQIPSSAGSITAGTYRVNGVII